LAVDAKIAQDSAGNIADVSGSLGYGALCECDGKAIDPNVAPFIP